MNRLLMSALCVLAEAAVAHAQTTPLNLTLAEAITRGLEASDRLAELAARQDAARAVADQRESAARPQLSLVASYTRTNHVEEFGVPNATGGIRILYPDVPDNVRSRIDLQWPIYTAGRFRALTRAAGAEANATGQDRESARADLKLEITRAYWAVITAQASQDVVGQALERTNAHLVDVRNQLSVGLVPPSDVLSIEAQQARQQMLLIEAGGIVDSTSAEFRRLIGLDPDAPFEIQASPAPTAQPPGAATGPAAGTAASTAALAQSFRAAAAQARSNRPERKALEFRVGAAVERAAAASAGSLPVLTAIGGYDFARPNPRIFPIQKEWKPSWDLGVSVRWPIFDGGRTRAEVAEAVANRRAIEARLHDLDAQIDVEVRQRAADLRSAQAAIDAARTGVRAAAEARRVLAERFSAGVANNTDVLTAQTVLLQADLDLTRAIANAQLAAARLERAMGR